MSELIVIGYDDHASAEKAYDTVQALQKDLIVNLTGLALVKVDEKGKTHVDTPAKIVGASAASGALWGLVFGLLFLVPGLALAGAAFGGLFGKLAKSGLNNDFRRRVHEVVHPGSSGVVIMATKITEDKFNAALQPFGGTVLKTSLNEQDERELAEQLSGPAN